MKYLSIFTPDAKAAGNPHSKEVGEKMGKLIEESLKSGELLMTGGLLPVSKGGMRARSVGGKITVVDGPYTESKELVAGFAILQYQSKDAATEGIRKFLQIAGEGEVVLHPIEDPTQG
jgi:hypothetical protein